MKSTVANRRLPPFAFTTLAALVIVCCGLPLQAQNSNGLDLQRDAMHKLSFLVGHWSGPVTVNRGPNQTLHLTQTEDVQYKLGGLVLLIEGKSTNAQGKVVFNALATVAFDDETNGYRIRAYNDGHYVDTPLSVVKDSFSWSFDAGPAHVTNTMHLTAKGEWHEVSEVAFGKNPPHATVEMQLHRKR